MAVWLY